MKGYTESAIERWAIRALEAEKQLARAVDALSHIERCLMFPCSTNIDPRGYQLRIPTEEAVQVMVFETRAFLAPLKPETPT